MNEQPNSNKVCIVVVGIGSMSIASTANNEHIASTDLSFKVCRPTALNKLYPRRLCRSCDCILYCWLVLLLIAAVVGVVVVAAALLPPQSLEGASASVM